MEIQTNSLIIIISEGETCQRERERELQHNFSLARGGLRGEGWGMRGEGEGEGVRGEACVWTQYDDH